MFERKGPEQQSLNGQGQNSNVYKDRARMQTHLCDAAGMYTLHGLNWKHPETHNSSGNQDVRQLPLGQGLGGQHIELHPHYPLVRIKRFMSWNEKLKPPQLGSTVMMWYVLLLTNLAFSLEIAHTNNGKTELCACQRPGSCCESWNSGLSISNHQ